MNKTLYRIFTIGLLAGIAVMLAGYIYSFASSISPENMSMDTNNLINLFTARRFSPDLLLYLGLAVVTLTPVAGSIFALAYYLIHKQYRFAAAAAAILLVLAAGVWIGYLRS
ncbi:MAG: DUF1634 domain-containing protein [Actinomycetota bacterium]|nr:DUF1634 domain-containing protein [Actinomycetota bacterium]